LSDHVLMLVVWKLDIELQLRRRIAECVTHIIAWRSLRMTHRTNWRPRTTEELWAVTTHARIVAGVIGDIGKPDLVTRNTSCLVLWC
jgi:hypothetical protein